MRERPLCFITAAVLGAPIKGTYQACARPCAARAEVTGPTHGDLTVTSVTLVGVEQCIILDGALAKLMLPRHSVAQVGLEEPLVEVLQGGQLRRHRRPVAQALRLLGDARLQQEQEQQE